MHRTWTKLTLISLGTSLAWISMGINACEQVEECDGIDNDNDGQVDEDFDQDLDGYLSAAMCADGDDCNDADPSINPAAAEVNDGIDNDCDGAVDEQNEPYTLTFVDVNTGAPVPNVAVWLGLDGQGPSGYSDANGQITFLLASRIQDLSFGYDVEYTVGSGSPRNEHRIYTYRVQDLTQVETILLGRAPASVTYQDKEITGEGFDTALAEDTFSGFYTNNLFYSDLVYNTTQTITMSERQGREPYALVGQFPNCYDLNCSNMPMTFGISRSSDAQVTVPLNRSFDQTLSLNLLNIDASMTTALHYQDLAITSDSHLYFNTPEYSLDDPASRELPFPSLTGELSGTDFVAWASVRGDRGSQEVDFPWERGSGKVDVRFPNMVRTTSYEPLSLATLEGTEIDVLNDDGSDREVLYYYAYQYYTAANGKTGRTRNLWVVSSNQDDASLVFATIPEGLYALKPVENPTSEIVLASIYASFGYSDGGEIGYSIPTLALAETANGRAPALSSSEQRRSREQLRLEAPVFKR